jgi:hypothetical protein
MLRQRCIWSLWLPMSEPNLHIRVIGGGQRRWADAAELATVARGTSLGGVL